MVRLPSSMKYLFAVEGHLNIQESIQLGLFRRGQRNEPATPCISVNEDNNDERGVQSYQNKGYFASLDSLLRFMNGLSSAWNRFFSGWRGGVAGFTILAFIVLIINLSILVWTATHMEDSLYATIAIGTYQDISRLSGQIHFGINILSTVLIAGSNYCMQCLTSPTRSEVDEVHSRGSYLNIGILSWRNAFATRKRRIGLLFILMLSSIILHPVYDTSFLVTTAIQQYTAAIITPAMLSGTDIAVEDPTTYSTFNFSEPTRLRYIQNIINSGDLQNASLWENISASDCSRYKKIQTERSTLLIIANETATQMSSNTDPLLRPFRQSVYSNLLSGFLRYDMYPGHYVVQSEQKYFNHNTRWHTQISYCLARKVPGRNRLQIHIWLFLTATILNTVKLVCLLYTFKEQQGTPLITTGDAIASFLGSRSMHSAGMCLLSQQEIGLKLSDRLDDSVDTTTTRKRFESKQLRYYQSVSVNHWIVYISSFVFITIYSIYLFYKVKRGFQTASADFNLRSLWKIGFGELNENSLSDRTLCDFDFFRKVARSDDEKWMKCRKKYVAANVIILASLPQVFVSAMYFALNHQFTLMVQLRDWASLASRRQAIRVTDPEPGSDQVSTYWLSLPYRYSIPLLLTSVSLGWLVSQTIFIVRYIDYKDSNIDGVPQVWYNIGYSAIALICSLLLGSVVFGVSVAIGACRCPPGMSLGPSNSLVIAAACHPPEEDDHAARKLIKWGAVPAEENNENFNAPHHCTITSQRVDYPIEGEWYE